MDQSVFLNQAYVQSALSYMPQRLPKLNAGFEELLINTGLAYQDWTNPFGRGYIYELFITPDGSYSMVVMVSVISPLFTSYFALRNKSGDPDQLSRDPVASDEDCFNSQQQLQAMIDAGLSSKGLRKIDYGELGCKLAGGNEMSIRELFFDNPED